MQAPKQRDSKNTEGNEGTEVHLYFKHTLVAVQGLEQGGGHFKGQKAAVHVVTCALKYIISCGIVST